MKRLSRMVFLLLLGLTTSRLSFTQTKAKPLTNNDVVAMVKAGLTDDVIIGSMSAQDTEFDVSASALLGLKQQGVSSKVMDAMIATLSKGRESKSTQTGLSPSPSDGPGNGTLSNSAATAPEKQPAELKQDISGTYVGQFRCGIAKFELRLSVSAGNPDSLNAVFNFSPVFPQDTKQRFVYDLTGTYQLNTRKFQLDPMKWESAPLPGYQMTGVKGKYDPVSQRLNGKIDNLFCGAVHLTRDQSQTSDSLPPQPVTARPAKQ